MDEKGDSAPDAGASTSRQQRKRSVNVEPRTPLKRQRLPVQKFQSPATEELMPVKPKASKDKDKDKDEVSLIHKKGTFLAVRGDEGSFYLCKTAQNVFNNTKKFKIQWLDLDQPPDTYKIDFLDTTDVECLLTNIKMERVAKDTFRLPHKEQTRVEEILKKSIKKERGEPIENEAPVSGNDDDEESEDEEEEEEAWEDDEPVPAKRARGKAQSPKGKGRKPLTVALKGKKGSSRSKGDKKDKKGAKSKEKEKGKKKKKSESKEKKKGPDRNLKPNPKIKVLEKEPFFETKEPTEFISKSVQGKLAIRAILTKDKALLQSLTEDMEHVYELNRRRSVDSSKTALHYALEQNNHEMIKVLLTDYFDAKNQRLKEGIRQHVLIKPGETGSFNRMSLGGIRAIRAISQSRGCKEGNDAFTKDVAHDENVDLEDFIEDSLKLGVTKETFDVLLTSVQGQDRSGLLSRGVCNVYQAVLCGNRKLAGYLIEEDMKAPWGSGFGYLHRDILNFTNEDLGKTILSASVRKKPYENKSITPLHCAAINPNVKYITRLLSVEPNINLEDRDHRRPIHFAAVCDGTGPLEYLLSRGASPNEVDTQGMAPLHYACSAGRARNVDILLKKAKEDASKQDELVLSKWGPGGVDRPSRSSYCPIHIAVNQGHSDVLKILIKHQVDVKKAVSAGKNRLTPLMMAASHGHLDMARILVQNGATVEQPDKLKRTALMHAVINGNTHVASYLLYLGSDPDKADSSLNTVVHYAAAYGWYHCLKLLVEAGADPSRPNDWKTTPVSIAFLKGHIGLVNFLLNQPGVDINFKNDEGMTLTSVATSSSLGRGLYEQVAYLVQEKKADPTIVDVKGMDSLHHLASNKVTSTPKYQTEIDQEKMDLSVKIATLLLDAGCDPAIKNSDGKTSLMLAVEQVNTELVELLVSRGGIVTSHKTEEGKTLLHMMADLCVDRDMSQILTILIEQRKNPVAKKAVDKKEENGPKDGQQDGESTEENMEVDSEADKPAEQATGDKAVVNGMDTDPSPPARPKRERMISESQEDIWTTMALDIDYEGYTPLLCACKAYRNLKKSYHMEDSDVIQGSNNGRNFMKTLLDLTGANVSDHVKEQTFEGDPPEREKDRYTKDGKCSALHMMMHVGHEIMEGLESSGLELILSNIPNLEQRNLDGKTALIMAVEQNDLKALKMLIVGGADVNLRYTHTLGEVTPILVAAQDNHAETLKLLMEAKADVNVTNSKTKESPLQMAVQWRSNETTTVEVVKMLLEAGADINKGSMSPLHHAVMSNLGTANASTELEEFMISKGANAFAKDEKNRLPIHYAFISKSNPDSMSTLDPIELVNVLTDAMDNKQLEAADNNGDTPLHLAATRGATISCVHLLQRGVSISLQDNTGNTAFGLAVLNIHDSCAILLLQKGASVEDQIVISPGEKRSWRKYYEKNKKYPVWQWKPLCIEPIHEIKKFALYQGALQGELQGVAHMVLDTSGLDGRAVEAALRVDKYHVALRHLSRIKDASKLTGYRNSDKQNLFHVLALHTRPASETNLQLKVAKLMLERGVSVSVTDKYKRTPLMYAAYKHQSSELGKFLLDNNKSCDLSKTDMYGRTILAALFWNYDMIYANAKDTTNWVKLLVDAKASLDILYTFPLYTTPTFDITIREAAPDFFVQHADCPHISPLIAAIRNSDIGLTKFLLQSGASPNLADKNRVTPLMHAVKSNDLMIVKLLLNYNYNMTDEEKKRQDKPVLQKKLSRQVFVIKPSQNNPKAVPEEDEDEIENDDAESDPADDDNEGDNEDGGENKDGEEDDFVEDEDDHDTDVMEDEEEEDEEGAQHLPIPRLGSKQLSVKHSAVLAEKTEDYPVVEKTSDVELNVLDKQGWTVVHHLVCPLEYGTFDNDEILYVLAKAGAKLEEKDMAGLTPLNRALISGAVRLSKMLQNLTKVDPEKEEQPTFPPFQVSDSCSSTLPSDPVDFQADAEEMLKKFGESEAGKASQEIVGPKPDTMCLFKDSGEVMFDKEQNLPYDVTLSKIDVRSLLYDMYNFYKMQIIWHKGKNIYILFTRWGRIGDSGQYQNTPYQRLADAVVEFSKIFRSKTGNLWSIVKKFANQTNKYRLVQQDNTNCPAVKVDINLESSLPSALPTETQQLLAEMANVGMIEAAMKSSNISEIFMPLGRIKKTSLLEAREILQKLGDVVIQIEKQKRDISTMDTGELQRNCEKIAELTADYYHLVPQDGYAYDRVHPLNSKQLLKAQMGRISNLLDLEFASRILLGAQNKLSAMNPLDYIYRSLNCFIQPLREEDVEAQYILKYIHSSKSSTDVKVINIFKIQRAGEDDRLKTLAMKNHRLLWHGSGFSNFLSILNRGLLVAPPEAPMTGNLFGQGIYSSDSFVKSHNYSWNCNPDSDFNLALLCEVALGSTKEDIGCSMDVEMVGSELNSLKVCGHSEPNPDCEIAMPFGASMTLGCLKTSKWKSPEGHLPRVPYNEYIVQDPAQVCLRYLVQFV